MDADSLEPVIIAKPNLSERKSRESSKKKDRSRKDKSKKDKSKQNKKDNEKDDIFGQFGIQTIEDLLGDVKDLDEPVSEISEIKTASESEEIVTERSDRVLGGFQNDKSRSEVIVSEIRTRSNTPKYSEDFDSSISERIGETTKQDKYHSGSEIRTDYSDDETEQISEKFSSDSESLMTESRATPTSDRTITDSYSYTYR